MGDVRLGELGVRDHDHGRGAADVLLAFLVYNDGVGTIIKMAAVYGEEVGIDSNQLIAALVVVQFVGIPSTFAFGHLSERMTAKRGILGCLVIYSLIASIGFVMDASWQFWLLAVMVGTVQGGVQGLSRSLYASMIPEGRSTEFFGFYSVSSKFAGITGPLFFAIVGQTTGSSRWGILSLLVFFVVGGALLLRVDVSAGRALARERERELRPKTAG